VADDAHVPECDACGYELRGLPRKHKCPECGTPYNHESCELEIPRAGPYWREFIGVTAFAAFFVIASRTYDGPSPWSALGFLLVYMLYLLWKIRRVRASDDRLILTHDTVIIVLRGRAQRTPIADIHRARFDRWRHALVLANHAGGRILSVPAGDLGGARRARIAADWITDWVRSAAYYGSLDTPPRAHDGSLTERASASDTPRTG
jgi:predicted RNA-binding Zn-ribbon protein involved in translation (DUF1610 family)